jgi:hypothetical protein
LFIFTGVIALASCGDEGEDSNPSKNKGGSAGSGDSGAAGEAGDGGSTSGASGRGATGGSAGTAGSTSGGRGGTSGAGNIGGEGGFGGDAGGVAGEGGESSGGTNAGSGGAGSGGTAGSGGSAGTSLGAHCTGCARTKIGSPLWEPTGAVLFAGNVGSASRDPLIATTNAIVAPNHAWDANDGSIGPVVAHTGPYNDEIYSLVTARNFTVKQSFTVSEFTAPSGVIIMLNIVPSAGAATGSSFDFSSGPIIANSLFPLVVDDDVFRNGVIFDSASNSSFVGYPNQNPPIARDGPSHLLYVFGENNSFGPSATAADGSYDFRAAVTDSTGAGWLLFIPFTVG